MLEKVGKRLGAAQERERPQIPATPATDGRRVRLVNNGRVFGMLNEAVDMLWPTEEMKTLGGTNGWGEWHPTNGIEGSISHYWMVPESDPTPDPLHCCRLPVEILVIRTYCEFDNSFRFFAAAIDALEPADGCKVCNLIISLLTGSCNSKLIINLKTHKLGAY